MHLRKKKYLLLSLSAAALFFFCRLAAEATEPYRNQEILFSIEDSFCSSDCFLTLSTFLDSSIYYTTDGSIPDSSSSLYQDPILLSADASTQAAVIRAVAIYKDGSQSDVYTKTYFTGAGVQERFSSLIVSLSADPETFYDYDSGILMSGRLRDDYAMEHPGESFDDTAPANYNLRGPQSERRVHAEFFDADGSPLLSQDIGIRVHGAASRGSDMKSLRLIARKSYGGSRFTAELFPENDSGSASSIQEYQKLLLRNHGNDQEYGYIRNELAQRLAEDAGFPDTVRFRPAAVYLNGEYYGFEWFEETFDDTYFDTHYGKSRDSGIWMTAEPHRGEPEAVTGSEEEKLSLDGIRRLYSYAGKDLRNDETFAELEQLLDIDNFLFYNAIEIYLANPDWPDNNMKLYRWDSDSGSCSAPCRDGKWRCLLYDLDLSMDRIPDSSAENPSLSEALGGVSGAWDRSEPLLQAILQREDMQLRFAEIMEELINGAFSPSHACGVLDELHAGMEQELAYYIEYLALSDETSPDLYFLQHQLETDKIKDFFSERPARMRQELKKLPACSAPSQSATISKLCAPAAPGAISYFSNIMTGFSAAFT